jgi:hypothetical protein
MVEENQGLPGKALILPASHHGKRGATPKMPRPPPGDIPKRAQLAQLYFKINKKAVRVFPFRGKVIIRQILTSGTEPNRAGVKTTMPHGWRMP